MIPRLPVLAELFDALPVGLVALDRTGRVVIFNSAEERLARRSRAAVLGKPFFSEVAPCMNVRELGGDFFAHIGSSAFERRLEFTVPIPFLEQPRDVVVTMRSFEAEGEPFAALMIEDVSLQRSLDRMKEQLSTLLVHDLKNPLAVAVANLGLLERRPSVAADDKARDLVARARDATARLNRMLLNLLDITRLDTNEMPLAQRELQAAALLRAVASSEEALAGALRIEVDAPAEFSVVADEHVLRRALENLVDNALRHARERVVVRARDEGARVVFEVDDDGRGVPDEAKPKVFDRFATEGARRTNYGLGLTFVRLAAEAHGGSAEVLDAPGGGARFRLSLVKRGD